ncbi:hypothetical protein SAMN06269185_1609 [Natronoarchaeum philippinense]|uniref:Uncharacterized protein n=1 Tax=Natronoarchaeum philippinense TaxID=558529 RepID=A0A285NTI1_NATPI|nr:hypothetical protein [Natronoarchaeum philippinense]SNZ12317.1 hypothetical protein SAMN06269185_1609 [Natronoarchaeum philippinense]
MFFDPYNRITNGGRYADDDLEILSVGANGVNVQIQARANETTVKIDTRGEQTVEIETRDGHLQTVET